MKKCVCGACREKNSDKNGGGSVEFDEVERMIWPDRHLVRAVWEAVIEGRTSRESAHSWSTTWMERAITRPKDLMVAVAIDHIHGFDMASLPHSPGLVHHGGPGVWIRSIDEILRDYRSWLLKCTNYDLDPVGWSATVPPYPDST
jgi:hypothetical protein